MGECNHSNNGHQCSKVENTTKTRRTQQNEWCSKQSLTKQVYHGARNSDKWDIILLVIAPLKAINIFFSVKLVELISVAKGELTLQTTTVTLSLCYN